MPAKRSRFQPPRKPRTSSPFSPVKSSKRVLIAESSRKGEGPTRSKYFEATQEQSSDNAPSTGGPLQSQANSKNIYEGHLATGDSEEERSARAQEDNEAELGDQEEDEEVRYTELGESSNSDTRANTRKAETEGASSAALRKRASAKSKSEVTSRKRNKPLAGKRGIKEITLRTGEIFIPNQVPAIGDVQYMDETIHPRTLKFLQELASNNDRTWFAGHDSLFRAAKQDFEKLVEKLSEKIITEVDQTVPELPLKDLVFRIYRDIRFSNDQTPYKVYFSAAWSRTGRKGPYAHYYLQIQPDNKSFAGGGIWQADARRLDLIRREIDRNPHRIKHILATSGIAKEFLGLKKAGDEVEAVKAFARKNAEDALKTAPKNYAKTHVDIELLRLRSFTVGRQLNDDEVTSGPVLHRVTNLFMKMEPLITYLNSVVMPDITTDANESNEDD